MLKSREVRLIAGVIVSLGGWGALTGCNSTPTPPAGDEYTTGAELDSERFAELPRAINPYAASAVGTLPAAADVLKNLPPIGDQGRMGSCTAWASAYAGATATANRSYQWGPDTQAHQGSPGDLYTRLVEADAARGTSCGTGTLIATAMDLLARTGCASLATVGYTDQACLEPSDSDAGNFRIGSYKRVDPRDRNGVKAELAAGNALVIGAELYDDFMDYRGGVYTGSGRFLEQNQQHAAHALALVGYDDARGAYRIMNSWSTQWGESGFMWMAYTTFEATVFEVYALLPNGEREPDPSPAPVIEDPEGHLDDAFQFADADPVSGEVTVYLVFYYHFDAPVLIHTITVTDPNGDSGAQDYETWFADGYVAFQKTGGFQWAAGTYTITFDTTTQAGNNIEYEGMVDIAALDDSQPSEDEVCSNLCEFAYDGECDDGGPDSDYSLCVYGSDCADCGSREKSQVEGELCSDTCAYAGDGECDDGGADSDYSVCDYGTDCADCGTRTSGDGGGEGESLCNDYCLFAFDGACDDGGPGSAFAVCEYGSDCADCGERSLSGASAARSVPAGGAPAVTHRFRGRVVEPKPAYANLPPAGVQAGDLGENDRPLRLEASGN